MTSKKMTVELAFDRETKRTYRFAEQGNQNLVGTLYVSKHAFEGQPASIRMTIEVIS
jgi:hypothetical protein